MHNSVTENLAASQVKEAITTAALLRLPQSMSRQEKDERVLRVMQQLVLFSPSSQRTHMAFLNPALSVSSWCCLPRLGTHICLRGMYVQIGHAVNILSISAPY